MGDRGTIPALCLVYGGVDSGSIRSRESAERLTDRVAMEQRAILVVEDTAAIAEIIETVLNDIPAYQATAMSNGADALAFGAEVQVDLVLLDINLPGLDGFAIYDILRQRGPTAMVPILFMTAGVHEAEFARRQVRGHIKKPFDLDDLLRRVASALGQDGTDAGPGGSTYVIPVWHQ